MVAFLFMSLSRQDLQILVYALDQPSGVPKALRPNAYALQDRLKHLLCQPTTPPEKNRVPIKSAWPANPTINSGKIKVDKPKTPKVPLIKSTTPKKPTLTVENVLKGLV